ncbi:MAG: DUF1804 family protein [Flavobacteriales bacterium]|jgi:transposase|nr:DUF1804 family protein [Flavobacteriales bacterium]
MNRSETNRKLATELYVKLGQSQKDIAAQLGVSEKTVGEWKKKLNWETLRASEVSGSKHVIKTLHSQISKICEMAADENRELTDKEADRISKIAAAVERLEKKATLGHVVQVMEEFILYLKGINLTLAQEVVKHQLNFIQKKAHEYK